MSGWYNVLHHARRKWKIRTGFTAQGTAQEKRKWYSQPISEFQGEKNLNMAQFNSIFWKLKLISSSWLKWIIFKNFCIESDSIFHRIRYRYIVSIALRHILFQTAFPIIADPKLPKVKCWICTGKRTLPPFRTDFSPILEILLVQIALILNRVYKGRFKIVDSDDWNHFLTWFQSVIFLIFLFLDWSQFGSVSCCVYSVIDNPQKLPSDQSCGSEICKFKMYRLDFWSILKSITWSTTPRDTILSSFKLNHAN